MTRAEQDAFWAAVERMKAKRSADALALRDLDDLLFVIGERRHGGPRMINMAWRAVDALGGAYDGPDGDALRRAKYNGYCEALDAATKEIEKLGGRDVSA